MDGTSASSAETMAVLFIGRCLNPGDQNLARLEKLMQSVESERL
jgi:hypothetical protein